MATLSISAIHENVLVLGLLRFGLWAMAAFAAALALFLLWHGSWPGFGALLAVAGLLAGIAALLPRPARGERLLRASAQGLELFRPHVRGAVPADLVAWSDIATMGEVQYRTSHYLVIAFTAEGARRLGLRPPHWQPSALMRHATGPKALVPVSVLPFPVSEHVTKLHPILEDQGLTLRPYSGWAGGKAKWEVVTLSDSQKQG